MAPPLRVVVAEDDALVREGVVSILERAGIQVVGVAADADTFVELARRERPDVILTDIQMPPDNVDAGLRAALTIRKSMPDIGVVVLSQFLDARYAMDVVGDGARGAGYLLKEKVASPSLLCDAVRRVAEGGSVLDPDVIAELVGRRRVASPLESLTPRESEVLRCMAEGHSNAAIAARLFVTVPAVERHVTGIFMKLGLRQEEQAQHRRVMAVLTFLRS